MVELRPFVWVPIPHRTTAVRMIDRHCELENQWLVTFDTVFKQSDKIFATILLSAVCISDHDAEIWAKQVYQLADMMMIVIMDEFMQMDGRHDATTCRMLKEGWSAIDVVASSIFYSFLKNKFFRLIIFYVSI